MATMKLVKIAEEVCVRCGCDMDEYHGELGIILMCCNCEDVRRPTPVAVDTASPECNCESCKRVRFNTESIGKSAVPLN